VIIEFLTGGYAPHIRVGAESAGTDPATIPVLPFVDLSPTPENEYFSDGLTEELIHALTKLPGMRVVAWNTAAQMRERQQDIPAIRRQLKVGSILSGSVRIAGSSLRVRAQLVDTESGVYRWSETFDRQMQDVFAIQEEIARAIVRTLRVQLGGAPEPRPLSRGRTSLAAYNWYLKGRYLWHRRSPEHLRQSVQCFENAIAADDGSALAYAGLADAFSLLVDYGLMSPVEGIAAAETAAGRAISLDPELAEPHVSLAFIRGTYEWQWEESERLYRRAIELNPGYATAHHWLGVDLYGVTGRFQEALAEIEIAAALDPLSSIILEGRGYVRMLLGRYEEAFEMYREILTFDPSFYKAYTSMGRACAQMGKHAEALELLQKGRSLAGDLPNILGALGQVYGQAGDRQNACALLKELEQLAETRYVPATTFAIVHLGLGNSAQALTFLEQACEARESALTGLKVHPVFASLRGEPRYQKLLEHLRLA